MFKILGIIVLIIFTIIAILLTALTINHQIQLKKEVKKYSPSDSIVLVNNKKMHVYKEGEGDTTLVFMAGHGTSNPALDFKPLWVKLKDEYKIAVVERSGYGWSETSSNPRDIDTVLEETRKALEASGENGPYVLFPHSMAGLEAIYWAQKYPDEVKAIIGLDPCTPQAVDILSEPEKTQLYAMYFVSRIGLSRLMPDSEVEKNFPLMKSEVLTEEDKQAYLAAFYRSSYSKDMLREVNHLRGNADIVEKKEAPSNTPMYFFISDGQEAIVEGWSLALSDYLSKINIGKSMQLDADHYVHYEKSEVIALQAKEFLKGLNLQR